MSPSPNPIKHLAPSHRLQRILHHILFHSAQLHPHSLARFCLRLLLRRKAAAGIRRRRAIPSDKRCRSRDASFLEGSVAKDEDQWESYSTRLTSCSLGAALQSPFEPKASRRSRTRLPGFRNSSVQSAINVQEGRSSCRRYKGQRSTLSIMRSSACCILLTDQTFASS